MHKVNLIYPSVAQLVRSFLSSFEEPFWLLLLVTRLVSKFVIGYLDSRHPSDTTKRSQVNWRPSHSFYAALLQHSINFKLTITMHIAQHMFLILFIRP